MMPVSMVTNTCRRGEPSFQNAGCLVWKSRTWFAVTFSMMPVTLVPGMLSFVNADLSDCESIWLSICSALIFGAIGAG